MDETPITAANPRGTRARGAPHSARTRLGPLSARGQGWHRFREGAGVSGSGGVGPIEAAPEPAAAPSARVATAGEARAAKASSMKVISRNRLPKCDAFSREKPGENVFPIQKTVRAI